MFMATDDSLNSNYIGQSRLFQVYLMHDVSGDGFTPAYSLTSYRYIGLRKSMLLQYAPQKYDSRYVSKPLTL
jgi:hypothetical protein